MSDMDLESLVITKLRTFFSDQGAMLDAIRDAHADGAAQSRLIARGLNIAEELETLAPNQIRAMLMNLHSRVDIRPDCVEINIRRDRLFELLGEQLIDPSAQGGKSDRESEDVLTLTVRARLHRVGREMRMLVESTDDQTTADPGLLRIVARAHEIQERLMQNTDLTCMLSPARNVSPQTMSIASYVFPRWRPTSSPQSSTARTRHNSPPRS